MTDSAPVAPCTPQQVVAADGAAVRFCTHGGHVLGWTPAGGSERLWLSRDTGCGPGVAVRGGIPVVWPQFAERGAGPRHGVARDRAWSLLHAGTDDSTDGGTARVRLQLRSDAATRALFPHPFTLDLYVEAVDGELRMRLTARNDGVEPLSFTAALHTYLRVSSTASAHVLGLAGRRARDNVTGKAMTWADQTVPAAGPVDLAFDDAHGDVHGDVHLVEADQQVLVRAEGFDSRVVWNPGPDAVPGDVHPSGQDEFVCIEPALLHPVALAPGRSWTGSQLLSALPV